MAATTTLNITITNDNSNYDNNNNALPPPSNPNLRKKQKFMIVKFACGDQKYSKGLFKDKIFVRKQKTRFY